MRLSPASASASFLLLLGGRGAGGAAAAFSLGPSAPLGRPPPPSSPSAETASFRDRRSRRRFAILPKWFTGEDDGPDERRRSRRVGGGRNSTAAVANDTSSATAVGLEEEDREYFAADAVEEYFRTEAAQQELEELRRELMGGGSNSTEMMSNGATGPPLSNGEKKDTTGGKKNGKMAYWGVPSVEEYFGTEHAKEQMRDLKQTIGISGDDDTKGGRATAFEEERARLEKEAVEAAAAAKLARDRRLEMTRRGMMERRFQKGPRKEKAEAKKKGEGEEEFKKKRFSSSIRVRPADDVGGGTRPQRSKAGPSVDALRRRLLEKKRQEDGEKKSGKKSYIPEGALPKMTSQSPSAPPSDLPHFADFGKPSPKKSKGPAAAPAAAAGVAVKDRASSAAESESKKKMEALQRQLLERNLMDGKESSKVGAAAVEAGVDAVRAQLEEVEVEREQEQEQEESKTPKNFFASSMTKVKTTVGPKKSPKEKEVESSSAKLEVPPAAEASAAPTAEVKEADDTKAESKPKPKPKPWDFKAITAAKAREIDQVMGAIMGKSSPKKKKTKEKESVVPSAKEAAKATATAAPKKRKENPVAAKVKEAEAKIADIKLNSDRKAAIDKMRRRYELQIEQLNAKIVSLTEQIERARGELNLKLAAERDRAEAEKAFLENKIRMLTEENLDLREATAEVEGKLAGSEAGAKSLWSNLVRERRESEEREAELRAEAELELNATRTEATRWRDEADGLRTELAESERRTDEAKDRIEALEKEMRALEVSGLEEKAREAEEWKGQLRSQASKHYSELEELKILAEQELNATRADALRLAEMSQALRADLERSEYRASSAEERAEELLGVLRQSVMDGKAEKERELEELEGRLTDQFGEHVEELVNMRLAVEQELDSTRANVETLVETSEGLRADLEQSEARVSDAEGRVEALQVQLKELEISSEESKTKELQDLEQQLRSQFSKRVEEMATKSQLLSDQLKTFKTSTSRHAEIIRAKALKESQELKDEILGLQKELEEAKSELTAAHEKAAEQEEAVRSKEEEQSEKVESLSLAVRNLVERLRALKIESEKKISVEKASGLAETKTLKEKVVTLMKELKETKLEHNEELSKQIEKANAELGAFQEKSDQRVKEIEEMAEEERQLLEKQLAAAQKLLGVARTQLARVVDTARNLFGDDEEAKDSASGKAGKEESLAEQIKFLTQVLHTAKVQSKSMLVDIQTQASAQRKKLEDQIVSLRAEVESARADLAREVESSRKLRDDLNDVRSNMTKHLMAVRTENSKAVQEAELKLCQELKEVKEARATERSEYERKLSALEQELADARSEVVRLCSELETARNAAATQAQQALGGGFPGNPVVSASQPHNAAATSTGDAPAAKSVEETAEEARIAAERLTTFLTSSKKAIDTMNKAHDALDKAHEYKANLVSEQPTSVLAGDPKPNEPSISATEEALEKARLAEEQLTSFLSNNNSKPRNRPSVSWQWSAATARHHAANPAQQVPAAQTEAAETSASLQYMVEYDNGARDLHLSAKNLRPVDPNVRELKVGVRVEVSLFHTGALVAPSVSMSRRGGVGGKGNYRKVGMIVDIRKVSN